MDVPVFLVTEKQKKTPLSAKFASDTKADILAVFDLLYARGMWSRYHYTHWTDQVKAYTSNEMLHLHWDAITAGSMFEVESPLEESIEEPEVEIEMPISAFKQMKGGGKHKGK